VVSYSRSRTRTLAAKRLVEKMAGALRDIPAKVTVPRKTAELRVTGLEDSIIPEEVTVAVAEEGNCQTVGVIRAAPRSLDALPADSGKENRRQQRRGKRHSTRRQPPHTMVSGEGLPSPGTPTPSATSAWRRATCAGIARQRLTGRIVATGAAWKGIVQGTAWHGYLNARYARTWDCPRRTGWDLQRVSHPPAGGGTVQEIRPAFDEGDDATASKETKPLTGPTEARRDKEEIGRDDREGNSPEEEVMETEPSPT
jgi:hypothetical protein